MGVSQGGAAEMLAALARAAGSGGGRRLPPVHLWNPTHCGDIGMEIRRDGSWWHEGVRISRDPLVRLFSTILRKDEDGKIYLVTPGEKVIVHVEDAPFLAIRADRLEAPEGQVVAFTTNVGDVAAAGPENPLRVAEREGEPRPYVRVRGGLEARILRAPFYEMVEWAEEREGRLSLQSQGVWFDLGAA